MAKAAPPMTSSNRDPETKAGLSDRDQRALVALRPLCDAGTAKPLLELGWITDVRTQGSRALFRLALPNFAAGQRDRIASEARRLLLALEGIDDVQIELASPPSAGPIGAAGHGASPAGGPHRGRRSQGCGT